VIVENFDVQARRVVFVPEIKSILGWMPVHNYCWWCRWHRIYWERTAQIIGVCPAAEMIDINGCCARPVHFARRQPCQRKHAFLSSIEQYFLSPGVPRAFLLAVRSTPVTWSLGALCTPVSIRCSCREYRCAAGELCGRQAGRFILWLKTRAVWGSD
jgi:hypothetical protein